MPDCSDCISTAPSIAPATVPTPPESDVPPITAAAMTRSSASVPSELVAASRRAIDIAALTAVKSPISMNTFMITQRVFHAGEFGRFRIATDGIDVAAKARSRRKERHHHADADRNEDRNGNAVGDEQAALRKRDMVRLRVAADAAGRPRISVENRDGREDQRAGDTGEKNVSRPWPKREVKLRAPDAAQRQHPRDGSACDTFRPPSSRPRRSSPRFPRPSA